MTSGKPLYSLEFFPPKTPDGVAKLRAARRDLATLKPAFCSVTFGAGGSTREGTLATVLEIRAEGMEAAPHLSCIGSTRDGIRDVLAAIPQPGHPSPDRAARRPALGQRRRRRFPLRERAGAFIRTETGDCFHIDVAAYPEYHPQSRNAA